MNYEFLKDILGSPWQIEPRTLNSLYPIFKGMTSGLAIEPGEEPKEQKQYKLSAITHDILMDGCDDEIDDSSESASQSPQSKVINVIPMRSVLTKHDQECGPRGTRTLGKRLVDADADENVIGHILLIESGGGSASAVPEMTDAIQKCTKPIVVWIDGMACSAAYYIACYCSEIIAGRDFDSVGSIGTMTMFEGRKSKSPENEDGEVSVTIYADGSEEKNAGVEAAINDFNFTIIKEKSLNPFNKKFHADVMANRPQVLATQLRGATYFAQDVVGSLVDSIGEFSTAIDRVLALANFVAEPVAGEPTNNQQTTNTKIEMKQFTHVNTVLGVEAIEATDEGAFLNEEQLASIEERLELNQQLATERDTAVQSLESANATLGTAQATIAAAYDPFNAIDPAVAAAETPEAKAEAVRTLLAARPGVNPVQNLGTQDEIITDPEVDWEAINNLPHNKLVDENS